MSIRRRYSGEPDFGDLIHFVEDEATLVNDPLYSKEASSGYVDKREVPVKRKQLKTYVTAANEDTSRLQNSCPLCQRDHDLDKCEDFMKKSAEDSSLQRTSLAMGVIHQYLPITMQGAVNREEFGQSVKKNTLQVFMVTSTQGKANWKITVPIAMRIL